MEFEFPIYPFIWDYSDMYNLIEYESKILNQNDWDENIIYLLEKFPNSQIIESKQIISKDSAKNINIHTWYLYQKKVFESNNQNIKILTDSKLKFKANINCFIFDPNDIFDNTKIEIDEKNTKFTRICIIKNKKSIIPELIPSLYIHTHNIKGIFRFSPNDNNKINIKKNILNGIFYVQMDNLILKFIFEIK
jgi:hypothetical protein